MIREVKRTSQFKKDAKRFKHDAEVLSDLSTVVGCLSADIPLDPKYCDHALVNDPEERRDCHVNPDVVLLYRKIDGELHVLKLYRLGSHSELFR